MSRDFANRGAKRTAAGRARKAPPKRPSSRQSSSRRSASHRTVLHGPSFSAGAVLGAVLVILGAYAPELWQATSERLVHHGADTAEPKPTVTYQFDELLRTGQVVTKPDAYPALLEKTADDQTVEYVLQAAAFRDRTEADALRARLLLLSLPTKVHQVHLDTGRWFRVNVGPFTSQLEAQRVMTRLRENDLDAVLHKNRLDA